jgi:sugar lactone lactonase YvrE
MDGLSQLISREKFEPVKTQFKSVLNAASSPFGGIIGAGAVLLIASSVPAQNLFETSSGDGNIYEFTPGGAQSTFASGLPSPFGLAFNSAGNLFVADASGNIYEFTPGGGQSTFASGLADPEALAFNSAGNLFVSEHYSDDIYEYTPGGGQSTFASGADYSVGLAFQPVPEPSVLGLLAVGVTALIFHRRRKLAAWFISDYSRN